MADLAARFPGACHISPLKVVSATWPYGHAFLAILCVLRPLADVPHYVVDWPVRAGHRVWTHGQWPQVCRLCSLQRRTYKEDLRPHTVYLDASMCWIMRARHMKFLIRIRTNDQGVSLGRILGHVAHEQASRGRHEPTVSSEIRHRPH